MKRSARVRDAALACLTLAPLLLLIAPLRLVTESRMAPHMLLQIPMLIASGWALSVGPAKRWRWLRLFDAVDAHGLLGIVIASCVLAVWMVPTALDLALLSDPVRWVKYTSLWFAGLVLGRSPERMGTEIALFFIGSLVWMFASVGLIYQTLPERLCVSYLIDDQRWTGAGLVFASVLLAALGLGRLLDRRRSAVWPSA